MTTTPATTDAQCLDGECAGEPLDSDGDIYVSDACGGDDCNDGNADVYPGAPELCDGIDNQCPGDPGHGEVDEGCGAPMADIPGGCFDMGDHFDEGLWNNELPVHNVCITAFEMDVHEVTNAEYLACDNAGACDSPNPGPWYGNPAYDNFAVRYVPWQYAHDYCAWAGKRLPTEAEWEYAARGGACGQAVPVGG